MIISLIPQRRDDALTLSLAGDVLTLNGADMDLADLPEGATLPRGAVDCAWLVSDITRDAEGEISLTLILPHGAIPFPAPAAAQAVLFPEPITVTKDGPITLPAYTPEEEVAE